MTREEALALLKENLKNKNLVSHSLAVEAVMRELANHFNEDEDAWGMAGLLHDLDYESTFDKPKEHALKTAEILKGKVSEEIIDIIKAHNSDRLEMERKILAEKAIFPADPVTGLIVAATLMYPDRKLASVTPEFILRRYKEKSFARGIDRNQLAKCEEIGLGLEEFIAISLKGMQGIAQEIGL